MLKRLYLSFVFVVTCLLRTQVFHLWKSNSLPLFIISLYEYLNTIKYCIQIVVKATANQVNSLRKLSCVFGIRAHLALYCWFILCDAEENTIQGFFSLLFIFIFCCIVGVLPHAKCNQENSAPTFKHYTFIPANCVGK